MKSYAWAMTLAGVLPAVLGLAACSKAPAPQGNPGEKTFHLSGEVVKVDLEHNKLEVQHNAVEGLMPAMTMEFKVSAGDARSAHAGERIRADLIQEKSGDMRLEGIWPDDKVSMDTIAMGQQKLREDTNDRGKAAYREVGEKIPDFVLYDQDGHVVQSNRFQGKMVMINFIFTRCPVATMCPASTMKMQETQKLAKAQGVPNIEFVSISLDPTYDTPGVLRDYADARGIDTSNFSFLTGPEGAIKDLLTQFGVIAEFDGNILKHTLATLLVDKNGKIIWRADGSEWDPKDFVSKMKG